MNHGMDLETGHRDLVISIKKSETVDLMDYTDSGVQGKKNKIFSFPMLRRRF